MMTYNFILGDVNKTRGLFSHYPAMLPEYIHLLAHSCLHYVQTENGNILLHLGLLQKKNPLKFCHVVLKTDFYSSLNHKQWMLK